MGDFSNQLDSIWFKLKTKAGFCAQGIENVQAYVSKGKAYTDRAYYSLEFTSKSPEIAPKLKKASAGLGKIESSLGSIGGACLDAKAVAQMALAVSVLNEWVEVPPGRTNADAAKAFDELFGGAARFASKIPLLSPYAKLLEEVAITKFFQNMQEISEPMGSRTPRQRELKRAWDSIP